jgi:hypothetical protein
MANSLDVELKPIGLSDAGEIERAVSAFAGSPNGGLIVVASGASLIHRELIVTRGRHEPVGPIALAFKVSAVTARHGLELGQLRLQGFDADLGSAPYDFAARTMAAMNTRGAATKTTASAVHTSAHKNVTTVA